MRCLMGSQWSCWRRVRELQDWAEQVTTRARKFYAFSRQIDRRRTHTDRERQTTPRGDICSNRSPPNRKHGRRQWSMTSSLWRHVLSSLRICRTCYVKSDQIWPLILSAAINELDQQQSRLDDWCGVWSISISAKDDTVAENWAKN